MKAVLSAFLILLAVLAAPALGLATETGDRDAEAAQMPDGDPAPPTAGNETSAEDEADDPKDIMQNFTRHRPGACPEGPPCKIED